MSAATFRPLPTWPYPSTASWKRRSRGTFSASWSRTLELLDREIVMLKGSAVVIGANFRESDIRIDGYPRADARVPMHPGVAISFDSKHGRLTYATDVCEFWQHNVRSIALGLEALRAVDRFGVARRGEQYAGWKELPAGEGRGVIIANVDEAWGILLAAAGLDTSHKGAPGLDHDGYEIYRAAVKRTHPDLGGTDEAFVRVQAAYELIKAAA